MDYFRLAGDHIVSEFQHGMVKSVAFAMTFHRVADQYSTVVWLVVAKFEAEFP
jgi:hypothetical protein